MAFCPKCGNPAVDTFCEACTREQTPLLGESKKMELIVCSVCDRIKVQGKWRSMGAFDQFVKRHLRFAKEAQIIEVQFPRPVLVDKPKAFDLPLLLVGTVSKNIHPYEEEYEIPITVGKDLCDRCSLANSSYFEGILQLRRPRDEVSEFIEHKVQQEADVFITKVADVRGGIDFYITDQQYLLRFANGLHKAFGGEIKKAAHVQGYDHNKSKQLYRLNCLISLSKFWTGSIIQTEKKLVKVLKMGSVLKAFDIRRQKNTSLPCPSDDEYEELDPVQVVVSSTHPNCMILDPEDYQEIPLAHQPEDVKPGDSILVVEDTFGKWYMVGKDSNSS